MTKPRVFARVQDGQLVPWNLQEFADQFNRTHRLHPPKQGSKR